MTRMPAEWAPHERTWIGWPHNEEDWPGKFGAIPWAMAEIVRHLVPGERVGILVEDAGHEDAARALLGRVGVDLSRVDFLPCRTDRGWLRDAGPSFVLDGGRRAAVCWRFNAWAKYDDWKNDARVAEEVARFAGVPAVLPDVDGRRVVMEGGAIDVDGEGTLLCTEECLLDEVQARNPGLGREGTERVFREHLGVERVIWLGEGIVGDDTHGHVDDLARFVAPGRVVLCVEDDPSDDNYRRLQENRERLESARDAAGRRLEVIPLPMPAPLFFDGVRLPASYANFYIGNEAVLVPTFNDPKDRVALSLLAELFPGRRVVGIHAVDLVWGLGTIHCLTQQEPAAG